MAIDAVITWVNGDDPLHQQKLAAHLNPYDDKQFNADHSTRFNQRNELFFTLHSIHRFAPWIEKIYIVTDAQIPSFLPNLNTNLLQKIRIIDHTEIFPKPALPTFNSLSIETVLHCIPDLSTQFIYFNDDCMLLRPLDPNDFFQNERVVARGQWKTQRSAQWFSYFRSNNAHDHVQENSAQLAGFVEQFYCLTHMPFSINKSTLENFYHQNPEVFYKNCCYRLRNNDQFWPISLAYHLELQHNKVCFDNRWHTIMINTAFHSFKKINHRLSRARTDSSNAFLCIQSLDQADELTQQLINTWLIQHILT